MVTPGKPCDIEVWLSQLGLPSADRDYQPGHQRVLQLITLLADEGFVLRKPSFRVRVAGTNGKGSTSQFLAAALQACGMKVGLYTSPHINTFHERMRVNGEAISDKQLRELMAIVMPLALQAETSYFETATVLALLYFSMQQVDVEILEAGVGARLDATTAVAADMGLLTPVALDHQDWLGDTLELITKDKSYVFDGCQYALSAGQDSVVENILNECDYDVVYAEMFSRPLSMLGQHQQGNAGLAWQAIQHMKTDEALGDVIDDALSVQAISSLSIPGRLQCLPYQNFKFWLDAAHNEHAIAKLLPTLMAENMFFDVIILRTREDRDLSMCIPQLQQFARRLVVMTGSGAHDYTSIAEALNVETLHFNGSGLFLILGSFTTLGDTITWMNARNTKALGNE